MRLTVLFLLIGIGVSMSAVTYSQTTISLNLENKTIKEVFHEIEKNSEYIFFYYDEIIDVNRRVNIRMKNETIENILDKLFESTNNTYTIEDRQIFISQKKSIRHPMLLQQSARSISGKITDMDGEPLAGVNIVVKGTYIGTTTSMDGSFSLRIPQINPALIISYIGYKTEEIAVAGRTHIEAVLQPDELGLDEVLVIGYGFARKKDLTGSVVSVKGDKLKETASFSTIEALQGRAAGVTVLMESARPGEEANIRIRGNRSLKAINDPLYVIDGIPIVIGLSDLSMSDIESVEILKDASATAIYGSRGANGVVLITTKKGKVGKTQIEYNGYWGIQKASRTIPMMNGAEWVELVREANRSTNKSTPYPLTPSLDWDRKIGYFTSDPNVIRKIEMGYDAEGNWHPENVPYTDWTQAALKTSPISNHEISVRGGTEKIQLQTSVTYFNHEGIVKGQDYSRYSVRTNFDWELNDCVKAGGKTQFSHYDRNNGINLYDNVRNIYPLADIRDENGQYITERPGGDPQLWNQFLNLDNTRREQKKDRFLGSYYAEFKLPFHILYRTNVGIDMGFWQHGEFYGKLSSDRSGSEARAVNQKRNQKMYVWENILSYNTYINTDHELGITLLQSIQQDTQTENRIQVKDLPYESQLWNDVNSAQTIESIDSDYKRWRLASFMGRINYNLKNRYVATASARYDGSSRLAPGRKWVLFPSVAVAWRISEEPFMKNLNFLSELKVRLGYGVTGNTAIDPYKTQGSLEAGRYSYGSGGVLAFYQHEMPNPDLSWEKTAQWNMGIDFGFLNGRIGGVIDIYQQKTKDLLMERQLPIVSGFPGVMSNVGRIRNRGFEFTLNTVPVRTKDFKWSADFILATNKEEIIELYNGKKDDEGNKWFIGKPVKVFYDYKANGIWQLEDQEELSKWNNGFQPGEIKVVDKNGDYKITSEDRFILGQEDPKVTFSLSNYFVFKNMDFNFFINSAIGQMKEFDRNWSLNGRYNSSRVNYWKITGEDANGNPISNKSNEAPRPNKDFENPNYINSLYYFKSSFLRISQITLGYSLPYSVTHKWGISKLRVYGSVQNAYVFTGFPGTDPETGRNFNEPRPRTFLLGVNLAF